MENHKIIIEKSKSAKTEANGVIGVNPNKPEYGSIQLATTVFDTSSGFLAKRRTVHFLSGNVSELEELVQAFGLSVGDDYSKKVAPSRIIIKEATEPFFDGQAAKINPSNGETVTHLGSDVYRETVLIPANSDEQDSKLATDKMVATSANAGQAADEMAA